MVGSPKAREVLLMISVKLFREQSEYRGLIAYPYVQNLHIFYVSLRVRGSIELLT